MKNSELFSKTLSDANKFVDRVNKMSQEFPVLTKISKRIQWAIDHFDALEYTSILSIDNLVEDYTALIDERFTYYDHPDYRQNHNAHEQPVQDHNEHEQPVQVRESYSNIIYRSLVYVGSIAYNIFTHFHQNDSNHSVSPFAAQNENATSHEEHEHITPVSLILGNAAQQLHDACG